MPWKPLHDLRYASLSGDKPGTPKWEGFDPLYFGGGNPNWYQGQIGSTIFNNTNLDVASAGVTLAPDEKNILILRYFYFGAAKSIRRCRSPQRLSRRRLAVGSRTGRSRASSTSRGPT